MNPFVPIAVAMVLVAILFLALPLWRVWRDDHPVDGAALNQSVLHDQVGELQAELDAGLLDPSTYAEARKEIELQLKVVSADRRVTGPTHHRILAVALVVLIPLATVTLYRLVGSPLLAMYPQRAEMAQAKVPAVSAEQIQSMVAGLAQKLAQHPDDVPGWEMLARSYYALGRYPEAGAAYAHLSSLRPDNAEYLTSQALSLALSRNRNLQGEPETLLQRAVHLDPGNLRALSLSGSAAFDRSDYATAIAFWNRVLALVPPDSEVAIATRASITEAQARTRVGQ